MNVRFKALLMFTALAAPAGLALAQTAAPVAKPPVAPAAVAAPQPTVPQPGAQVPATQAERYAVAAVLFLFTVRLTVIGHRVLLRFREVYQ